MKEMSASSLKHFWPEMILIPAGEFLMGSDPQKDPDTYRNEEPQHSIYLPDYHLSKTPVTNIQYAMFVEQTGHRAPWYWRGGERPAGKEDHPVTHVSWHDALAYCQWLSELTESYYRLPTEAEWEKGARSTDGRIYPWGDQWDPTRCNTEEGGKGETTPVQAYVQGTSPYGLVDMAGNVWEWVQDWYQGDYYQNSPTDSPTGPPNGNYKTLRGGSWATGWNFARAAARSPYNPESSSSYLGFRCVEVLE